MPTYGSVTALYAVLTVWERVRSHGNGRSDGAGRNPVAPSMRGSQRTNELDAFKIAQKFCRVI
jgi:hypothetical protein